MAVRTIRTGVGTYQRPDGQWTHGVLGEKVQVSEDDLARFDNLNGSDIVDEGDALTQADIDAAAEMVRAEAEKVGQDKAALAAEGEDFDREKADLDQERSELEAAKAAFETAQAEAAQAHPTKPTTAKPAASTKANA